MSENGKKDDIKNEGKDRDHKLTINVETSAELEELRKQFKKAEDERKAAEKKLEEQATVYKKLEDEKGQLGVKVEDYEEKLKTHAEKEYKAKCAILIEKATEVFKDPVTGKPDQAKIDEMKKKLEDPEKGPENLRMSQYLVTHLEDLIKKGAEQAVAAKKAKEEKEAKGEGKDDKDGKGDKEGKGKDDEAKPANAKSTDAKSKEAATKEAGSEAGSKAGGVTPLTSQQTGTGDKPQTWDSHVAMIQDLRKRARDYSDPEGQAMAQATLDELWKKWAKQVKLDYHEEGRRMKEDEQKMPKIKELQRAPPRPKKGE